MTEILALAGFGFVLGMRHATDADHVIAVTTILSRSQKFLHSTLIGGLWGLGHTVTVLAGTMFRVELDNQHQVLATISGKMRKRFVRLTTGDRVKMEMSPYDLNKARITWRLG